MPLVTLEYTKNIKQHPDFIPVFSKLHELIVANIDAKLDGCKSRAVCREEFYIADGNDQERGFVQLTISILTGRDVEKRTALSNNCLAFLKQAYAEISKQQKIDFGIEIREIEKATYAQG